MADGPLPPKRRQPSRRRRAVAERAGGRCEYCRCPASYASDPFSEEHIQPRSAGGSDHLSNLAYSCLGCNNIKHTHTSGVDPATGEVAPLYNPRRHHWQEHFRWSEGFTEIVGLTPVGRATVERLQLNRPGVVNLRRALRLVGVHPPPDTRQQ